MLLVNTCRSEPHRRRRRVRRRPVRAGAPIWRLDPDFDRLIPVETHQSSPPHLEAPLDLFAYPYAGRPGFLV
jgi:uncharacterized protein